MATSLPLSSLTLIVYIQKLVSGTGDGCGSHSPELISLSPVTLVIPVLRHNLTLFSSSTMSVTGTRRPGPLLASKGSFYDWFLDH
jgi:hypothetical protein